MRTYDADAWIARRYGIYKSIFGICRHENVEPERFWSIPFDHLRFRVGESYQNLKIPYVLSPALQESTERAIEELVDLVLLRHEDPDAGSLAVDRDSRTLSPLSFHVDTRGTALTERVISTVQAIEPWLDAGLLRSWLEPPGRGAELLVQIFQACRKASREQRQPDWKEPTLFLTQLALLKAVAEVWSAHRARLGSSGLAPRMEIASAVALHSVFEEVVRACFESPSSKHTLAMDLRAEYLLMSAVSPLTFLPEPDAVFLTETNPYGFSFELYFAVNFQWRTADPLHDELDATVEAANKQMAKESVRVREVLEAAWLRELRAQILEVLGAEDDLGNEIVRELARLAIEPKLLRAAVFSISASQRLQSRLQVLAGKDERGGRFWRLSDRIAAGGMLRSNPDEAFGYKVDPDAVLKEAVRSIRVYQLDKLTRDWVGKTSGLLFERKAEGIEQITAEYESGGLYRFAGDDHPILHTRALGEESQLFVDLKDFTRQTQQMKEVNMADFLKGEFYGPMLELARGMVDDGGLSSLKLNNILGDALSFSGNVVSLLELAESTQDLLGNYREKLKTRIPQEAVQAEMARVEKTYQDEKRRIAEQRAVLQAVSRNLGSRLMKESKPSTKGQPPTDPQLDILGESNRVTNQLAELEQREQALETETGWKEAFLAGTELVAGIFVSHGAPAAMIRLETAFGDVKVAIAEKINESARGTGRSPEIKRRMELIVKLARERRGVPTLEFPFRVHIDRVWSLPVPPGMSDEFRGAAESLDDDQTAKAMARLSRIVEGEVKDARRKKAPLSSLTGTFELYNAGIAVSEETLIAYQQVTGKRYHFFAKSFDVLDLDEEFVDRFAFGQPRMRLVFVAVPGEDRPRHIFRFTGNMVFRGFERNPPTAIYEMLSARDPFHSMLVDRCYPTWYRIYRERRGTEGIEPFPPAGV